jgi:hypothetical protein
MNKIIIIARHGPREPITQIPILNNLKNFNNNTTYTMNANLTLNGQKYCINFGNFIKKKYNINVKNEEIFIASSNKERTIDSAINFLYGLLNKNTLNINNDKIQINIIDNILHKNDINHIIQYNALSSDINILNKIIKEKTHFNITSLNDYYYMYSTLKCYMFENINVSEIFNDKNIINKIYEYANKYYEEYYTDKIKLIYTKKIFLLIKKILQNNKIKFAYLSTHDNIIYPLASILLNKQIKIPDFCSYIIFETNNNKMNIEYVSDPNFDII